MKKIDLIIADEILRDQLALLRFSAGEKKKVFGLFLQMQKELKIKLQNGFTDYEKTRINKLLAECTKVINRFYADMQTQLDLVELAKHEAAASGTAIASIGIEASIPTAAVLKTLVKDSLIEGAPLSAWWSKQAEDTAFKFAAQVRQGVAQGETLAQITDRITGSVKHGTPGIMDMARRHASTLTHDAIMQIGNDAGMEVYKTNADIVKGLRQLSTLDSRTSSTCIAYSGAQWDLSGKPINGTKLPFNGGCPGHPNCRSLITPITKTYKELGLDISERAPGERASDLGPVPADMTFEAFLNRHDSAYLNKALGKGRAELYRSGKITLSQLVDGTGRELTLAQLKERAL